MGEAGLPAGQDPDSEGGGWGRNWVARRLGRLSTVVTLEKYNRYVPNLTREDGKVWWAANAMGKGSGPPEKFLGEYQ